MVDYLDEIIGQETPKKFIRTALKKDNLYNLLLIGPRGVGKRTLGFALAKQLGCPIHSSYFTLVAPIPSRIKEKEDKIGEYTKKYFPENPVVELEDRTAILIEQVRSIIQRLMHMPAKGSRRVVMILEADRMTDEAANAFLKTLEEPPVDTLFVLTSSRPHNLLPTIRSRCRIVPFSYLGTDRVSEILYEADDELLLGSPGEMLRLQQQDLIAEALKVFNGCPMTAKTAAATAKAYERRIIVDLFYPLVLLYRLALYRKIMGTSIHSSVKSSIDKKIRTVPPAQLLDAIQRLHHSIILLEHNPNRLLLLLDVLTRLP
ncbi:MAG: AAA family ATPase [candidate division WOR-3 bacterium]|nr:MAG: AAA family ATPase [candidate division WOR-3 bacterium]